jgi:hypothetical protein
MQSITFIQWVVLFCPLSRPFLIFGKDFPCPEIIVDKVCSKRLDESEISGILYVGKDPMEGTSMNISGNGYGAGISVHQGDFLRVKPVHVPESVPRGRSIRNGSESDIGVSDRVMAAIDEAGNAPGEVSVTTSPMGHGVLTDVSIREISQEDGTTTVRHRSGVSMGPKVETDGIGPLGRYEGSANLAAEVGLLYQGLKINQRV